MRTRFSIKDLAGKSIFVDIDEPDKCPLCNHAIKPQLLSSAIFETKERERWRASFIFLCKACYNSFLFQTSLTPSTIGYNQYGRPIIGPRVFIPESFSDPIATLSPNFVEIYNQAFAAEQYDLNHIAGIGYRKSLEFLVKDFIIAIDPSKEETVKKVQLGPCIKDFIDNEKIKALAKASTWIGNDETHYVRKHEDYNVDDLKKFIRALVSYIDSELTLREALQLTSK